MTHFAAPGHAHSVVSDTAKEIREKVIAVKKKVLDYRVEKEDGSIELWAQVIITPGEAKLLDELLEHARLYSNSHRDTEQKYGEFRSDIQQALRYFLGRSEIYIRQERNKLPEEDES